MFPKSKYMCFQKTLTLTLESKVQGDHFHLLEIVVYVLLNMMLQ